MDPAVSSFIEKIRTPALAVEAVTGIPWRFAMVQAAHESRYGQSKLAQIANNLFGVTGDSILSGRVPANMAMPDVKTWLAQNPEVSVIIMQTEEQSPYPPEKIRYWTRPGDVVSKINLGTGSNLFVERPFRKYADWLSSIQDWSDRLEVRYPIALAAAKAGDFPKFAAALQGEGYATDRKYAEQLIALNTALQDQA